MKAIELARLLEISPAHVSRVLGGNRNPSAKLVFLIQERLGWDAPFQFACLTGRRRQDYGVTLRKLMEKTDPIPWCAHCGANLYWEEHYGLTDKFKWVGKWRCSTNPVNPSNAPLTVGPHEPVVSTRPLPVEA